MFVSVKQKNTIGRYPKFDTLSFYKSERQEINDAFIKIGRNNCGKKSVTICQAQL